MSHRPAAVPRPRSSFAGFRFRPEDERVRRPANWRRTESIDSVSRHGVEQLADPPGHPQAAGQVHHERAVGLVDRPACGGPQVIDLDFEHRPEPRTVGVPQEVGGLGRAGRTSGRAGRPQRRTHPARQAAPPRGSGRSSAWTSSASTGVGHRRDEQALVDEGGGGAQHVGHGVSPHTPLRALRSKPGTAGSDPCR